MAMQLTTLAKLTSTAALSGARSKGYLVIDFGQAAWQGSSRVTQAIHHPLMQQQRVHLSGSTR
jgi:hypothetical protein